MSKQRWVIAIDPLPEARRGGVYARRTLSVLHNGDRGEVEYTTKPARVPLWLKAHVKSLQRLVSALSRRGPEP